MSLIWHVYVDWNGDRVYEADEGARLVSIPRIERGQDSQFDDPIVGVCELQLSNHDRRYDAWYSGSVMYPNIGVNRRIRISVEIGGTEYFLFTGRTSEPRSVGFRAAGAQGGSRLTMLTCQDGWALLQSRKATIDLVQDTTQKDAITALLNAVGWIESATVWSLGTGALGTTTALGGLYGDNVDLGSDDGDDIPYWWMFNDEKPSENLNQLVKMHFGRIHILTNGTLKWRTISGDNGAAADLTITDAMLQEMNIAYSVQTVRNKIALKPNPRALGAISDLWTLNETPKFAPGESRTYWAEYCNSIGEHVPAINVVTPASTTDYTANSAEDGSGTNLTASLTVTSTRYATNAKIVVTNSGTSDLYVTLLKIRGQAIDSQESQETIEEDTDSQEEYGLQELAVDMRWQQSTAVVQDLARFAIEAYAQPLPVIELRFENSPTALSYDLGAKITDGTSQGTGLNYRLMKIAHEIPEGANCQKILTTWTLLPIIPDYFWTLDASALDTTTMLGV